MDSGQIVTAVCLLVGGGLYVWLVRAARHRTLTRGTLIALSAISGGLLLAMVISDWPFQQMNSFWAEHSILGAVLSTLLLASVGYLAFEAGESARQSDLDRSVTIVGMSGLVDRLVDVEIALGMLAAPHSPYGPTDTKRPLEWLRESRAAYLASGEGAEGPTAAHDLADRPTADVEWRLGLIDECVRRIIGGMRDWAALVGLSEDGRQVLRRLGDVRLDLLTLQRHVRDAPGQPPNTLGLRRYLRIFAVALESVSSAGNPRYSVQHYLRSAEPFSVGPTLDGVSSSADLRRAFTILDRQHTDLVLNSDSPGNQVRIAKPDAESR